MAIGLNSQYYKTLVKVEWNVLRSSGKIKSWESYTRHEESSMGFDQNIYKSDKLKYVLKPLT